MVAEPKKRGRPRKHVDEAAKQAAHRAKVEAVERKELLKAIAKRIKKSEHAWQGGPLCTKEGCNSPHHKHVANVKQGVKKLINELEKLPIVELRSIAAEYKVIHDLKGRDRMEGFSGMRGANELELLAQPVQNTLGAGPDGSYSNPTGWVRSQYEPGPKDDSDAPRISIGKERKVDHAAIAKIAESGACPVCQFEGDVSEHLYAEVNRADAAKERIKTAREILEIATDASFPDSYLAAVSEEIKRLTKLLSAKTNSHLAAILHTKVDVPLRTPVCDAAPRPSAEQFERHAGETEQAWRDRISLHTTDGNVSCSSIRAYFGK